MRRKVVKALAQDIGALGHKVWFDKELVGGQVWWNEILTKIRDCDVFAFLLTPEALESTPCQLEYKYADSLAKPILPILVVDGVSIELLPSTLSHLQYVDYRRQDKQAAFALVKAFSSIPPAQPLPDPLPQPPRLPVSYLGALKEQVEATETLSFQEQTVLLFRLKERLSEPKNADEVYRLLARLRKRDDLYAKVADEIDLALATMKENSSSSAPSVTQVSTDETAYLSPAPQLTEEPTGIKQEAVIERFRPILQERVLPRIRYAVVDRVLTGESLVGDGNEVAHIDLIMGPRGSAAEEAFCNALTNQKDGFSALLALVAPNLPTKPYTILYNKVTMKGGKQILQMFGPAQRAVAMAVTESVESGLIPGSEADDIFICVGVFIHWLAEDDSKIQNYNYQATKEAIERALKRLPRVPDLLFHGQH